MKTHRAHPLHRLTQMASAVAVALALVACGGPADDVQSSEIDGLTSTSRPPVCHPRDCGPLPDMPTYLCPDGSIGGFTGRCLEDPRVVGPMPYCYWEVRSCPPSVAADTVDD